MKTDINYLNEVCSEEEMAFVKREISEKRVPYKKSFSIDKDLNFTIKFTQKSNNFSFSFCPCSNNEDLFLVTIGECDSYRPKKEICTYFLKKNIVVESIKLLNEVNFQNWFKCYGDLFEHDWSVKIETTEHCWYYDGNGVYPSDWEFFDQFVTVMTNSVRSSIKILELCWPRVNSVHFYEYFGGPSGVLKSSFFINRLANYSSQHYAVMSTFNSRFDEIYYPDDAQYEYFKESDNIISKKIFDEYVSVLKAIGVLKWKRPVNIPLGIDTPEWGIEVIFINGKSYGSYSSDSEDLAPPNGWASLLEENKKLFEMVGIPKAVSVNKLYF